MQAETPAERDQVAAAKSVSASKESELQVFVVHGPALAAGVSQAKPFCSTAAALLGCFPVFLVAFP